MELEAEAKIFYCFHIPALNAVPARFFINVILLMYANAGLLILQI